MSFSIFDLVARILCSSNKVAVVPCSVGVSRIGMCASDGMLYKVAGPCC